MSANVGVDGGRRCFYYCSTLTGGQMSEVGEGCRRTVLVRLLREPHEHCNKEKIKINPKYSKVKKNVPENYANGRRARKLTKYFLSHSHLLCY